jgi:hypothetical protein
MMNRRNRLRRAALLLALLVLAAIVTGVAASATNTVVPNQLTGRWGEMVVGRRGEVTIRRDRWYHLKVLHVSSQKFGQRGWLVISGMPSCSGTVGAYGWWIGGHLFHGGEWLNFKPIQDACKQRLQLLNVGGGFGPHRS